MKRVLSIIGLLVLWLSCGFAQMSKPASHPARSPKAFKYKKYKPQKHRAQKPYKMNKPHR